MGTAKWKGNYFFCEILNDALYNYVKLHVMFSGEVTVTAPAKL